MGYKVNTVFTASYDQLKNVFNSVKAQFNSLKIQSNSAITAVKNDIQQFGGATEVLTKTITGSTVAIASLTVPLTLAGYKALQTAGQYESATQTLEYTLGDAKKAVDDFVQNNAAKLGMAEQDAYQFANTYSNLLTTMTSDQETNANMTDKLLQASAVIMSKTGRSFTDVADRIRSGLLGNTEAIEDLGVNVNIALLETTDAFKQIANSRSWEQLSFQEQQQIRLLGILEQTSKKYGETVANNLSTKLSQTSAVFKNVKTNASQFLATGLEPMLNTINNIGNGLNVFIQYLNSLDDGTKKMVATFLVVVAIIPPIVLVFALLMKTINSFNLIIAKSTVLQKIFGKGLIRSVLGSALLVVAGIILLSSAFGGLGNVVQNVGSVIKVAFLTAGAVVVKCIAVIINLISILIPGLKGTVESMSSLANSMYSSAKNIVAQVKATGNVAKNGQDASNEINKLTNSQNKNADSAEKAAKANKKLSDNLQGFDEINKLNVDTASDDAGDTIGPTVDLSGINTGAFENVGGSFENLSSKVDEFKQKMEQIAPVIALVGTVLLGLGIAKLITDIISVAGGLGKILEILKSPTFLGIASIISGVLIGISGIKDIMNGDLYSGIIKVAAGVALLTIGVMALTGAFSIIPLVVIAIVTAVALAVVWICDNWEMIKQGFVNAWNAIKEFFKGIWEWICEKAKNIGESFGKIWTNIKDGFKNVWESIKTFFKGIWEWICQKAKNIGETFSTVWTNIKNGFKNVWDKIKEFASNIGTTVASAVGGTIKSVVNSIIGFAENTINGFIKAINLAIGVINAIPGVNISKINLLSIPRLANGGIATGSTLANIGEGKYDEAVIPLENSPQFTSMKKDIAEAVVEGLGRVDSGNTQKLEIDILAGGVRLGKKVIDLIKDTAEFYDMELEF